MKPMQGELYSERVPPLSTEAEQHVLGSMLIDEQAAALVQPILRAEDFYSSRHGVLYTAILIASRRFGKGDLETVYEYLKDQPGTTEVDGNLAESLGGLTYLTSLTNSVVSTANVEIMARIVEQKATLRRLQNEARQIVEDAYAAEDAGTLLAEAEARVQRVSQIGRASCRERV